MSTIQQTVSISMAANGLGRHTSKANPVIDALVKREQAGAQRILDYAADLGANVDEVREFLDRLGVALPDVADAEHPDGVVAQIVAQVRSLTEFARSKGYRG